jgi:hypothetical protein
MAMLVRLGNRRVCTRQAWAGQISGGVGRSLRGRVLRQGLTLHPTRCKFNILMMLLYRESGTHKEAVEH